MRKFFSLDLKKTAGVRSVPDRARLFLFSLLAASLLSTGIALAQQTSSTVTTAVAPTTGLAPSAQTAAQVTATQTPASPTPAAQTPPPQTASPQIVQPVVANPPTPPVTLAAPAVATTDSGIKLAAPPPATAFSNDPNQLAIQAEQTALQAQLKAEQDERKREIEHNIKSYDRAASGLLPLSPDQIHDFMRKLEQTQDASQAPSSGPPKGEVRIVNLSLDPGVNPPQINLASGYVTTINMVDVTGEPWPILDVGVGGNFEVSPTASGSHVVRVMPLSRVASGNISVLLKDLPTPVIFRLTAGGNSVDLRLDARLSKMGPNAKAPLIEKSRLQAGSQSMMQILENAPPPEAKPMKVSGVDARTKAWSLGDRVMVRTPLTLLSPSWDSSVSSGDGTTVYDIGDAPVLLMSENGAMVRAQLVRDDDHDK